MKLKNALAVLLSSVAMLAACSPSTPVQPPKFNNVELKMSPLARLQATARFHAALNRMDKLSRQEYLANFADVDSKGNVLRDDQPAAAAPNIWGHKDLTEDGVPGTSTAKAYRELKIREDGEPVIVAVIDSGLDITHEDLKANIWVNERELNGKPGADNDGNGYVGDVNGWNFLGTPDGGSVTWANLEVTREVRRMRKLQETTVLTETQKAYLKQVETAFEEDSGQVKATLKLRTDNRDELASSLEVLSKATQTNVTTLEQVKAIESDDEVVLKAKAVALKYLEKGWDLARFKTSIEYWTNTLKYQYDLSFDPGLAVQDHPEILDEKGYGNANVMPGGEDEIHATHVAGIIGAVRNNGIGMDGQVANVKIMPLHAVPDGDERDKDVANAIRYAVDHGARIINMSFGKAWSPDREYVWNAIRYAREHDVLLVHAAGNSSLDNDLNTGYPNRLVRNESGSVVEVLENVMEIGASTESPDKDLPAEFSDFGQTSVDLFAPGQDIYATFPGNAYESISGTSMATPEVAGIAALLLTQYPKLTSAQIKQLLMGSVTRFDGLQVVLPGSDPENPTMVPFINLSVAGGVVNAFEALKAAAQL